MDQEPVARRLQARPPPQLLKWGKEEMLAEIPGQTHAVVVVVVVVVVDVDTAWGEAPKDNG